MSKPNYKKGDEKFGKDLRFWRESHHITRESMAQKLGISATMVQHVELGYKMLGSAARKNLERLKAQYDGTGNGGQMMERPPAYPGNAEPAVSDADLERIVQIARSDGTGERVSKVADLLGIPEERAWVVVIREELGKEKT